VDRRESILLKVRKKVREGVMQRRAIALFTPTIQDMMNIARMADNAGFDSV